MYSPYLMHFCGRRHLDDPDKQDATLAAILTSRRFNTSRWRMLRAASEGLKLELYPDDAGTQDDANSILGSAISDLDRLSFKMACFTDLPLPSLMEHTHKFGSFGIALKKGSPATLMCHPVHYIRETSPIVNLFAAAAIGRDAKSSFVSALSRLVDTSEDVRTQINEAFDGLQKGHDQLERARLAFTEDARHIEQHEWRFVQFADVPPMTFSPADVAFVFVDTIARASDWNRRFYDAQPSVHTDSRTTAATGQQDLTEYGRSGVIAVPLELLR